MHLCLLKSFILQNEERRKKKSLIPYVDIHIDLKLYSKLIGEFTGKQNGHKDKLNYVFSQVY